MNSAIPVYSHSAPKTFSARNLSSPARRLCCRKIIDVKIMCVLACVYARACVIMYVLACAFLCVTEKQRQHEREGGERKVSKLVTWCFTPSQPLRLYAGGGGGGKRDRQTDRDGDTETDRERQKQRETETDRDRNKQADRQRETDRDRETAGQRERKWSKMVVEKRKRREKKKKKKKKKKRD